MRTLETIANATNGQVLEEHILDLPIACCPVSKNPRPGSTIAISYCPTGCSLEVGSLYAYLHQFRGGLRDEQGELIVRDMEGMIMRIAQDCAQVIRRKVSVLATVELAPKQQMRMSVEANPEKGME